MNHTTTYYVWRRHETDAHRAHLDGYIGCTASSAGPPKGHPAGEWFETLHEGTDWPTARQRLIEARNDRIEG